MGLKNGNTGSSYTKTVEMSASEKKDPKYMSSNPADYSKSYRTTPNLQNVPWSYYSDVKNSRRGSEVSSSSVDSSSSI